MCAAKKQFAENVQLSIPFLWLLHHVTEPGDATKEFLHAPNSRIKSF